MDKIVKDIFEWEQNIIICFLYIPPSDSNWHRNGKSFNFEKSKNEAAVYKDEESCLLICVDFNARVGLKPDFIQNDDIDDFLPLSENHLIMNQSRNRTA